MDISPKAATTLLAQYNSISGQAKSMFTSFPLNQMIEASEYISNTGQYSPEESKLNRKESYGNRKEQSLRSGSREFHRSMAEKYRKQHPLRQAMK